LLELSRAVVFCRLPRGCVILALDGRDCSDMVVTAEVEAAVVVVAVASCSQFV
jgi:hypothetical protein